ncbi:MAG TPA: phytanoyl-CoA dioxygenase family protein [Planctomycetota bacterium]|nr:phytanoyl-CoA dioxygenase family protein [Planctomycetota bacterium]
MSTAVSARRYTSFGKPLDTSAARLGSLVPTPQTLHGDMAALHKRYDQHGYLWLKGILPRENVLAFRRYYFSVMAEIGVVKPGTDPVLGMYSGTQVKGLPLQEKRAQIVRSEEYNRLCTHPAIVNFYKAFLKDANPLLLKRKIVRHVEPDSKDATGAHYDLVYIREGTTKICTSWIPLGDTPADQGALIYLEGSAAYYVNQDRMTNGKQAGWLTTDIPALASERNLRWLTADYEAGDMVVHSPFMVHASLDNTRNDGTMRLSTDIRYQPGSEPDDKRWRNDWRHDDGL